MSLKAKVEAIIYAAEEPITLEQIALLLNDIVLADLASAEENAAIEQADSAVEAATIVSEEGTLPPEFTSQATEMYPSEARPSEHTAPVDAELQSPEENTSNEALPTEESVPESLPEPEASDFPAEMPEPAPEAPVQLNAEPSPTDGQAVSPTEETASAEESAPAESASVDAPETTSRKRQPKKTEKETADEKAVLARVREILIELVTDYAHEDRGMEIRQVAGGFRMATKPEHHDVVRAFAKSLKPPIRLSLAALETLAVIAYKQPITAPEICDIRSVESASVLGTLLDRKLITTAGRKQVIGRPMQYKTSKDFLLRFGLNNVNELPSMEEFSQLASDGTIEIAPAEVQDNLSLFEPETQGTEASQPAPEGEAEFPSAPTEQSQDVEPLEAEAKSLEPINPEATDPGSQVPEPQQSDPAGPAASQPESDAESSNIPEADPSVSR